MTRIEWAPLRDFETGVDRGVVYISDGAVPWNGITNIEEDPGESTTSSYYFDGVKTLDQVSGEDFTAHISAYICPEELDDYRGLFGFVYRTIHGDGHKIHLLYNVRMVDTTQAWTTDGDKVNLSDFTWDLYTTPVATPSLKPFAHLIIDVDPAHPDNISAIEDLLYGTDSTDPTLPSPEEVIDLFEENAILTVVDHGDGTWTATGPDEMVHMIDGTTFEIVSPTVAYSNPDTYNVSNY